MWICHCRHTHTHTHTQISIFFFFFSWWHITCSLHVFNKCIDFFGSQYSTWIITCMWHYSSDVYACQLRKLTAVFEISMDLEREREREREVRVKPNSWVQCFLHVQQLWHTYNCNYTPVVAVKPPLVASLASLVGFPQCHQSLRKTILWIPFPFWH